MISAAKEKLAKRMAGEIALSDDPGKTMRKWREIFGVTQTELAKRLGVSSSVLSDYEGGRRKSPGSTTIKKFVEGLLDLDEENGGKVIHAFGRMFSTDLSTDAIIDVREFSVPKKISELCESVEGEIVANADLMNRPIYGYTVIDSIKAILEMTADEFLRLYGWSTERALIFTKVDMGRSPMVAIKVKGLKPSAVVVNGPKKMDEVAVKIAEIEKIPLILSRTPSIDLLIKNLRSISD
ncbi:MAG: helix-turn-helix domain-containing protein [Candidatus Methanofastidiosa archaeon]|nr:helix-turn-helix domain-containing protein [Candidatus Methanofastidiosa archaeon]